MDSITGEALVLAGMIVLFMAFVAWNYHAYWYAVSVAILACILIFIGFKAVVKGDST